MHEVSVAENIVEIITQHVDRDSLNRVRSVAVTAGTFSGIVPDSLEFAYQAITDSTELAKSFLVIEQIPFVIRCRECSAESAGEEGIMQCPQCGSADTTVVSGKELLIKEIELDDIITEPA
jgi:hydrogenase nickel incorporation protein HypA/HybF